MRSATEMSREMGTTAIPELGMDAFTSPTPAVGGAPRGRVAWTGSDQGLNLARALGWFSIGLGLAEVMAPRELARMVGLKPKKHTMAVMRLLGLREIGAGLGILANPRSPIWVGTRVAGDIIDLALLGSIMVSGSRDRYKTTAATLLVLGVTTLDVMATELLSEARKTPTPKLAPDLRHTPIYDSITVEAPIHEVYEFWRDPTNFPSFMRHLESVQDLGNGRSRWRAKGPDGSKAEWEAELVQEVENSCIAWRSTGTSEIDNSGVVRFKAAPGGRGTIITVEMRYAPPGGKIGAAFLKLLRKEPGQEVAESLRAFKQVIETGEILLSDATAVPGPHPARPPSPQELMR